MLIQPHQAVSSFECLEGPVFSKSPFLIDPNDARRRRWSDLVSEQASNGNRFLSVRHDFIILCYSVSLLTALRH